VIFVSLLLLLPVAPVDASQVCERIACQQQRLRVKMTTIRASLLQVCTDWSIFAADVESVFNECQVVLVRW